MKCSELKKGKTGVPSCEATNPTTSPEIVRKPNKVAVGLYFANVGLAQLWVMKNLRGSWKMAIDSRHHALKWGAGLKPSPGTPFLSRDIMITPTPMSLVRRLLAKLRVLSVSSCRLIVAGTFFSLVIVPRKWRLQERVSHYKHYHMLGGLNLPNEQVNAKVGSFVIHTHLVAVWVLILNLFLWICFKKSWQVGRP